MGKAGGLRLFRDVYAVLGWVLAEYVFEVRENLFYSQVLTAAN